MLFCALVSMNQITFSFSIVRCLKSQATQGSQEQDMIYEEYGTNVHE